MFGDLQPIGNILIYRVHNRVVDIVDVFINSMF